MVGNPGIFEPTTPTECSRFQVSAFASLDCIIAVTSLPGFLTRCLPRLASTYVGDQVGLGFNYSAPHVPVLCLDLRGHLWGRGVVGGRGSGGLGAGCGEWEARRRPAWLVARVGGGGNSGWAEWVRRQSGGRGEGWVSTPRAGVCQGGELVGGWLCFLFYWFWVVARCRFGNVQGWSGFSFWMGALGPAGVVRGTGVYYLA
jgi:hypothetical protein